MVKTCINKKRLGVPYAAKESDIFFSPFFGRFSDSTLLSHFSDEKINFTAKKIAQKNGLQLKKYSSKKWLKNRPDQKMSLQFYPYQKILPLPKTP